MTIAMRKKKWVPEETSKGLIWGAQERTYKEKPYEWRLFS